MSQISGPTPLKKTPRTRNVKWSPGRDEFDPRSVIFGVLLAALIWPTLLLLLWLATRHLGNETIDPSLKVARAKPKFEVSVVDDFIMPSKPQKPPLQFVETNPEAPENIPDKTNNFGARNTQASQEKPNPDANGDRAATEGKKDFQSNQVVNGELQPPREAPPPEPPPTPEIAAALEKASAANKAENPLPGVEKMEGLNPNGFGMNKAENSDNVTKSDQKVEGVKDAPLTVGQMSPSQPRIDPRKPQPRLRLDKPNTRPAIFQENKLGSRNNGPASFDSRWSDYGAYLSRMSEAVQMQWEHMLFQSGIKPPNGSVVVVKFRMDKTGAIAEIIETPATNTGGTQYQSICVTAMTSRAPYGVWTDDMVAILGDSQVMTWTFYYGDPP
ncbi:MAG: hypothetical protein QM715_16000 [Nibricoccus sp.]